MPDPTVVCKPSDKTPRSTAAAATMLADVLPPGVVNVVHGSADVGRALVQTDVDGVAFTGSADVGWQIVGATAPNGLPRPVLAEMGGQNPAIVGASADLDLAAAGIVRSAYGLSGDRRRDRGRIDAALRIAAEEGRLLTGERLRRAGNWFAPIVVADLPAGHELTREELFAPLLTITQVETFDEALAEANDVRYGLSAGVFSHDDDEVDRFVDEIEAGVIYVNRAAGATTGAWPGVQSFRGWKRSGSSGKGGLGHWYLQGFMREQSRTIARAT